MLTCFSTPKPFVGPFAVIQRNAITSWTKLSPRPEVILYGDSQGTAQICEDLGLKHVPVVATTELGTPLLSDLFAMASSQSSNPLLCYVNADIILTDRLLEAAKLVSEWRPRFFLVGRRFDVAMPNAIRFESNDWEADLMRKVGAEGRLDSEISIDWFLYPKAELPPIPPFAIGRLWWDNWLIWNAAEQGLPVVDATAFVPVVHQRHDYSHAGGTNAIWNGPEARRNRELMGHWSHWHAVAHARWMLTPSGAIVPARGWHYRVARPRRWLSHALRFTRPLRRRLRR